MTQRSDLALILRAPLERLRKDLERVGGLVQNHFKGWQQGMTAAGQKLESIGKTLSLRLTAPILGLGAALLGLASKGGQAADQLLDIRDAFGVSLQFLQGLKAVATEVQIPFEAFPRAFQMISMKLKDMRSQADVPQIFRDLDVAIFDASGKMRLMEEILLDIIEVLNGIENPMERARLGSELFGEQWERIGPVVALGRKEVEKIIEETPKLADETVEAAAKSSAAWEGIKLRLEQALITMAAELLPFMEGTLVPFVTKQLVPALEKFAGWIGQIVAWFQKLPPWAQMALAGFIGFLAVLGPLVVILGTIVITGGALIGVLTAISIPVLVIIALIVGLIAVGVLLAMHWEEVTAEFAAAWQEMKEAVGKAVEGIKGGLSGLWGEIKDQAKGTVNFLIEMAEVWANGWVEAANAIIRALNSIQVSIPDWAPGIGGRSFGINLPSISPISLPRLEHGGEIARSGLAIVGEAGAELLELPTGARVTPLPAGSGGTTVDMRGATVFGFDEFQRRVAQAGMEILRGGGWQRRR